MLRGLILWIYFDRRSEVSFQVLSYPPPPHLEYLHKTVWAKPSGYPAQGQKKLKNKKHQNLKWGNRQLKTPPTLPSFSPLVGVRVNNTITSHNWENPINQWLLKPNQSLHLLRRSLLHQSKTSSPRLTDTSNDPNSNKPSKSQIKVQFSYFNSI